MFLRKPISPYSSLNTVQLSVSNAKTFLWSVSGAVCNTCVFDRPSEGRDQPWPELVGHLMSSGGPKRRELRAAVVDQIRGSRLSERALENVVNLILATGRAGRIGEAADVLTLIEPSLLKDFVRAVQGRGGPTEQSRDLYVAVIRALGAHKDLRAVLDYRSSPFPALREAVVDALERIGGADARTALEEIAEHDESPAIRGLAEEALADG